MIVEERMYTLHVGKLRQFLETYEHDGLPVLRRHLGNLYGFFVNEVGPQNLIVHLWAFENFEDRSKRRAALAEDPAFATFRTKNHANILSQETRIMVPSAFFEPVLMAMLKAGNAEFAKR